MQQRDPGGAHDHGSGQGERTLAHESVQRWSVGQLLPGDLKMTLAKRLQLINRS